MIHIKDKAQLIRLFVFDIDGTMTSGKIYYTCQGEQFRAYDIKDGFAIKLLRSAGIEVAVISGKNSPSIRDRLAELKIEHLWLGFDDKMPAYETLKKTLQVDDKEIAYIGDDLPDIPLLRRSGLSITVNDAPAIVKKHADYITTKSPGAGAIREAVEIIIKAQGKLEDIFKSYEANVP